MFCEHCHKAGRPQQDDWFFVFRRNHNAIDLVQVPSRISRKRSGFVPHLIKKLKTEDGIVSFNSLCAMDGCGMLIHRDKKGEPVRVNTAGYIIYDLFGEYPYYIDDQNKVQYFGRNEATYFSFEQLQNPKDWKMKSSDWNALVKFTDTGYKM